MVDGVESEHDAEGTLGIPSAFLGFICGGTSTRGVRCLSMIPIHRVKHFSHVCTALHAWTLSVIGLPWQNLRKI